MAGNLSDQFHSEMIGRRVDINRAAENIRQQVFSFLQDLQTEFQSQIGSADLAGLTPPRRPKGAEQLIKNVSGPINNAYDGMETVLADSLVGVGKSESIAIPQIMGDAIRGDINSVRLSNIELQTLASDSWINGSPAAQWWASQSNTLKQRFSQQIRLGVAMGETNDQLVARIIGGRTGAKIPITDPKTGKTVMVDQYAKGIMDLSRRDAMNLVRTAVQSISNEVAYQTYLANADILKGLQAVATLDNRTTPYCRKIDKGAWDLKGEPLPQSPVQTKFPGKPPYHFCCRTFLIPVTKSWDQLIHDQHGSKKTGVSSDEAMSRMDQTKGTDARNNNAASPLPVIGVDLGPGGKAIVSRAARATIAVDVTPTELYLTTPTLDYGDVATAIDNGNRAGIIAVRKNGRLIVVSNPERAAAAVYANEATVPIRVADFPQSGRLIGDEIGAPVVPAPSHGLIGPKSPAMPVSTRASMDGQVASDLSYSDWLAGKSSGFQDEVLGPARGKLFRAGAIGLSDLVDTTGRALTLEEIDSKVNPIRDESAEPTWNDYTANELVRFAGKMGLTPAQTRLMLSSLGVDIPANTTLYDNLDAGAAGQNVPVLSPGDLQTIQSLVERIKNGKIIKGKTK